MRSVEESYSYYPLTNLINRSYSNTFQTSIIYWYRFKTMNIIQATEEPRYAFNWFEFCIIIIIKRFTVSKCIYAL